MNAVLQQTTGFTYADYCRWSAEERWELIDGEAYAMTAPSRWHQELLFELAGQIRNYLKDKPCKGYAAIQSQAIPQLDNLQQRVPAFPTDKNTPFPPCCMRLRLTREKNDISNCRFRRDAIP